LLILHHEDDDVWSWQWALAPIPHRFLTKEPPSVNKVQL
jgi:hypothetical protein